MCDLTSPIYNNPTAARKHLEAIRWPDGPVCPHCGEAENTKPLEGKSHRAGLHKCYSCSSPFTVTVGTVFERSKVPLHKWILASHLFASSKKGFSAHQLHRTIGVTYKTAWFMMHRLREASRESHPEQMGGGGKTVEVDETFIGKAREKHPKSRGPAHMNKVLTLVERGGRSRSMVVDNLKAKTLVPIIEEQIKADSRIMTDEACQYMRLNESFPDHHVVKHGQGEYVRGEAYTNTIEGFFSIFKRGMKGVYQHCGKQHLPRYLAEFDFRYNYREKLGYTDTQRAEALIKGIEGKRLQYS